MPARLGRRSDRQDSGNAGCTGALHHARDVSRELLVGKMGVRVEEIHGGKLFDRPTISKNRGLVPYCGRRGPAAYNRRMLYSFGRLLQAAGLAILPLAMVMQLTGGLRAPTGNVSVSVMLLLMVFGVVLFSLGRVVQGYAGK